MRTRKIRLNSVPSIGYTVEVDGLKDGKSKEVKQRVVYTCNVDTDGRRLRLNVDQFSGKRFMLNSNGFPMNDIEAFEQCQSDSLAQAVLNRINVIHPENLPQNLTPEEMFDLVTPSNWSSPAEYVRASKVFASKLYAQEQNRAAARAAQVAAAEAAAKVSKKDKEVTVEPE